MTIPLRDRLYGDTGLPIQGATVQAYTITGGGTDAGTASTLAASTTTDVNGVWKFAALADPGAGNWYDVKIINGQQVRWRYGNIQADLAALALAQSFTVTSGNVWDYTAATTKLSDPFVTGQFYVGTVAQTLPVVTGNAGKWRYYKAYGGSLTINGPAANTIIAPGATGTSTAYTSPNGESTDWYCDGANWWCI